MESKYVNESFDNLKIVYVEQDIVWENVSANLKQIELVVSTYADQADIIVFPEMCTTGFTSSAQSYGESADGQTLSFIRSLAATYGVAICGSCIIEEAGRYYNRAFFVAKEAEYFYDKRHLFRLGAETDIFSGGHQKTIFNFKGYNICLLVCYDLRFPVWSRNVDNEYDLLIYVANWPAPRIHVWEKLLKARAIENVSYVCGVNRVGTDGMGIHYNGCSAVVDAKGFEMSARILDAGIGIVEISKNDLITFRKKFPVWMDADRFEILD